MWHEEVRQDVMEDGKLKSIVSDHTDPEFDEMPELAIGVLQNAIWFRGFVILHFGEDPKLLDELFKFKIEWVYRGQPLDKKTAYELALQQDNSWDVEMALLRIKRKGRPIKSRHTAIKALFRKVYLDKSWKEVTQRLCQCGQSHDDKSPEDKLRLQLCQGRLEAEVRLLKKELKKYGVVFPPSRPKETQTTHEPPPQEYVRVPKTHSIQHPAIAIFVDGDSVPETQMTRESHDDEIDTWYMFNQWEPGWIPMWFPQIRSEPIGTREELQQRRLEWFDRAFRHFAGTDWPLRGPLESQRAVVADTLLRMYRIARDEYNTEIEDLQPLYS